MSLIKITDRIYCLPFESVSDRPNLYYIKGDNYSVAIDAGNSKVHVEKFYNELKEMGFELPKYTIITHWHWDHTFGMHAVVGTTIASSKTQEKLKEVMGWKWTFEDMVQREREGKDIKFCNEHILYEYADLDEIKVVLADEVVEDERELALGGVTLKLMAKDSTHSRDSLFILAIEQKALFIGDADCEDYYDNNSMYDARKLEEMTSFFKSLDYEIHLIGHAEQMSKAEEMNFLSSVMMQINNPMTGF